MLDSYRDLIDELLGTPSAVRAAVESPRAEPADHGWRLIAEVRDRDRLVTSRLQTMLRENDAHLAPIPDAEPEFSGDKTEVLTGMDLARGDLVSLLMNLTLKDWERRATHDIDGEISLVDEVERHVEFDEDHLQRIQAAFAGTAT